MNVNSEFEVKQFVLYLNKFENLSILRRSFSDNYWNITLNDSATYNIHDLVWSLIQDQVPRLSVNKVVIQ